MLTSGQIVSLEIEKPAVGGPMIARHDGQVVLVAGAIPGERVTARIDHIAKQVAHARTIAVEQPSPDRCDTAIDPACGGCLYAHIAYPRQLEIKSLIVADAFARIGRLPLGNPVRVAPSPATSGYRMRARWHQRGRRIGFFREGSHDVCDARATGLLLPATCDALERLGGQLVQHDATATREIELAENIDASERVMHIDGVSSDAATLLERHAEEFQLTGLSVSGASSGQVRVLSGSVHVTDVFACGDGKPPVAIRRHVLAFFQGNRYLLRDLVSHVVSHAPPDGEVVDLYAGTGVFSVPIAQARGGGVTAVEGDRIAFDDLHVNAAAAAGPVTTVHQAVEDFTASSRVRPRALIVDPPRTGMSRAALAGAIGLGALRIVYVSCDVATLARDARGLTDGGYRLAQMDAFDMFPNTPHVETVAVFDRR